MNLQLFIGSHNLKIGSAELKVSEAFETGLYNSVFLVVVVNLGGKNE